MFLITIFTRQTRRLRLQTSLAAVTMDNFTALLDKAADLVANSYNYGNRLAATPVANFFRCRFSNFNSSGFRDCATKSEGFYPFCCCEQKGLSVGQMMKLINSP
jgi:hypothetical protein